MNMLEQKSFKWLELYDTEKDADCFTEANINNIDTGWKECRTVLDVLRWYVKIAINNKFEIVDFDIVDGKINLWIQDFGMQTLAVED